MFFFTDLFCYLFIWEWPRHCSLLIIIFFKLYNQQTVIAIVETKMSKGFVFAFIVIYLLVMSLVNAFVLDIAIGLLGMGIRILWEKEIQTDPWSLRLNIPSFACTSRDMSLLSYNLNWLIGESSDLHAVQQLIHYLLNCLHSVTASLSVRKRLSCA